MRELELKVGPKGGVSLYGMGKWPVTLYRGQWMRLLGYAEKIEAFIREHDAELNVQPWERLDGNNTEVRVSQDS